jgi:membrane peptidoglycan carboxypeptidase
VPDGDCQRVLKRDVADTVTVMLNGVVDGSIPGRTGQAMVIPERQVAGKTGTTNDSAAVWFAGYTPQIAAAVWVGDPRGGFAYPMKNVTINGRYYSQVFGGTLPGPIWRDSMEKALAGTEPLRFDIKNKYGLTTKDPYTYTYVPSTTKPSKNDGKNTDSTTGTDASPAPDAGTDTGATPPAASGPPQPTEPGTFDNSTPNP